MVFFLGALTFFVCSVLGAVHAVSVAAAQTENRPVIVLDAGHGGEDGGAVGVNGVEEKTVNLAGKTRSCGLPRENDSRNGHRRRRYHTEHIKRTKAV